MISQIDRHSIATLAVRCTSDDYNLCAFPLAATVLRALQRDRPASTVAGSRDLIIPGGIHQPPHRPDLALPHRWRPIVSLSPADLDWLLSRPLLPLNCAGNAIGISSAKEGISEKRLIPDSVWQAGHTGWKWRTNLIDIPVRTWALVSLQALMGAARHDWATNLSHTGKAG